MDHFDIIESTDAMKQILHLVDWEALSMPQKWMISQIVNFKFSRRDLIAAWKKKFDENLRFEAIETAIMRAALSRPWEKGMAGGNQPFLCDQDMKALEQVIKDRAMICKALNTVTILDEAGRLKNLRLLKAVEFLKALGADRSAQSIALDDTEGPCKTWINSIEQKINIHLSKLNFIDG